MKRAGPHWIQVHYLEGLRRQILDQLRIRAIIPSMHVPFHTLHDHPVPSLPLSLSGTEHFTEHFTDHFTERFAEARRNELSFVILPDFHMAGTHSPRLVTADNVHEQGPPRSPYI